VRLGLVLQPPWADDAALAEELGFDLVWIEEDAALVVAAALAPVTSGIRVVASVAAGPNPVVIAEEAAVADLALNGRLVLAVHGDDEALLHETVELLFHAFAARPFRHEGERWRAPARLPEHEHAEARMRVTPPPAQLEPTIWLHGDAAPAVARESGLAFVGGGAREPGLATQRQRRPAFFTEPDVDTLLRAQSEWGMDIAILRLPADERERTLRTIARDVRPRLQIDRLPAGVEQHWDERPRD
jgi:alkanesulfonate monooxygenase SsuD/methylene tetrahydromethanopterin reductase-like flavin-dependent oxidoreductase (luciferase family)